MPKPAILLAVPLAAAVWLGSTAVPAAAKGTKSTGPPTTLPIVTVPSSAGSAPTDAAAPTGKILMVKLYVGDLAAGEQFYGAVFGAKLAIKVGENAHIVTFPDGGPGLVLLKKGADDKKKQGSFIVQVPN